MLYIQLPEAVDSARKIGLEATIILILLLALVSGFGLIVRWLIRRSDEKDKQLLIEIDKRGADVTKTESALQSINGALRENALGLSAVRSSLDELAREQRARRTKV
jgi:ABC-type Na+ efflux pump permease subunit